VTGRFVVLEGLDGTGKTTQAARLAKRLAAEGFSAVVTREPGATPVGAAIREIVLGREDLDPRTEALLVAADRAEHVVRVVRPALEAGSVVVSDRYTPSSLAYQGRGRELGVEEVERLSRWATDGLEPDLVVVLDVDDETLAGRREGPGDRLEREPAGFRDEVGRAYRELAADRPGWVLVDGAGTVDEVAERVWKAVQPILA
jgi:dTMP kinase